MHALATFTALAFALCLGLTPLCRELFFRLGIVDHPDEVRKFHLRAVPRIGGVAIVLAYAGALAIMLLFAPAGARIAVQHSTLILRLLPATGVIFLTGLLDDLLTLRPWQKLAGQLLAAALAVSLGAPLSLWHGHASSPWFAVPLSMLWLIGCTNALNLIDGMDGLATGVGLFAAITASIVAILQGNVGLAMATAPLAGCLLAFLRYNFNPASVFLGDSGSLTLGFMLGCFSLIWSRHSGGRLGMAAPLMVLALPIIDVGLAIGRRLLRGKPIFGADRGHIHHMMLARGYKPREAALLLYGVCALAGCMALLQSFSDRRFHGVVLLVFVGLAWIGINYLGYVELTAARRTFSRRLLMRLMKEEIYVQEFSRSLTKAQSVEECWAILVSACRDLGFASVRMYLNGASFEHAFIDVSDEPPWNLRVGFGREGILTLTRAQETRPPLHMMMVLDRFQQIVGEREHLLTNLACKAS